MHLVPDQSPITADVEVSVETMESLLDTLMAG
jgi:hypothetical protein